MSKTRYKLGDMFLVAVSDQLKAVGRVLRKDYNTIFVEMYSTRSEQTKLYGL